MSQGSASDIEVGYAPGNLQLLALFMNKKSPIGIKMDVHYVYEDSLIYTIHSFRITDHIHMTTRPETRIAPS